MASPVNKIATILYTQHTNAFNQKDLALDLSSTGELKVVQDTYFNRLTLFVKNLWSWGHRNATILNLAKQACNIQGCDSLSALQNVKVELSNEDIITEATAEQFAMMLRNGHFYCSPYIEDQGNVEYGDYKISFERFKHPLVDVKLTPLENVHGASLPAPLATKVNLLLDDKVGYYSLTTIADQYGSVTIEKIKSKNV